MSVEQAESISIDEDDFFLGSSSCTYKLHVHQRLSKFFDSKIAPKESDGPKSSPKDARKIVIFWTRNGPNSGTQNDRNFAKRNDKS